MSKLDDMIESLAHKNKSELLSYIHKLENKLEQVTEQYETLFHTSHEAVVLLKGNQIVEANEKALDMMKCTKEEILSRPFDDFLPDGKEGDKNPRLVAREKIEEALSQAIVNYDGYLRRVNGEVFEALFVLKRIEKAAEPHILCLVKDISKHRKAERNFQEQESMIRSLAENAPVMFRTTNVNNAFIYFSKQWLNFTGKSLKQEQKNGWLDNIHPDDLTNVLQRIDLAFKKRQQYEITYRLKNRDENYRWVLDTGIPQFNAEQEFTGYIAATIDITERKAADERLRMEAANRLSKERFRSSMEKASFLAITTDMEGNIHYCNQALLEATGFSKAEVIDKNFFDVFVPEEKLKAYKSSFSEMIRRKGVPVNLEARIINKEGRPVYLKYSTFILNNTEGEMDGLTIIAENITEEVRIRNILRKRNAQLRELFDTSNDLIQFFGADYNLTFANKAWLDRLGYTNKDLANLNFKSIIHPEYRKKTMAQLQEIADGKDVTVFRTRLLNKFGRSVDVEGKVKCTHEHGEVLEFRGVFHDITAQVKAEKAQQLYYSIANLAIHSSDLDSLYGNIHSELQKVIPVDNFYIALFDQKEKQLVFPYYVDENFGSEVMSMERRLGKGLTEYIMNLNKALFLHEEDIVRLIADGKVDPGGTMPKIWMGVPLRLVNKTIGVICVQCYDNRNTLDHKDLEFLDFISGQVALIIERKRNEEKINNQQARLNAIFESESHEMWSVNRNYELTSFNRSFSDAFYREHGFSPLMLNSPDYKKKYIHKTHFKQWEEEYKKAFTGVSQHFETKMVDTSGKEIWKEIFLNPIFTADGMVSEVSGIALEITEKKQAALALKESEENYRNIFESFLDIYFTCDLQGNITLLSPSVQELMGYEPEEVLHKNITDYYLYTSRTKNLIRKLIKQQNVRNFEASLIRKDGVIVQCICNIRLLFDKNNRPVGIEGVARDITSLKKANEELVRAKDIAEKSLKVKEQFLANMSHEIRTPMNGIIGMIDLLNATALNNDQKHYVQTIKKSSGTLLNILNDILDLSKIEAGKMSLKNSAIKVEGMLDKVKALFEQQAASKMIELKTNIGKELPPYVMADETRLLQIFSNLVSNAIKFTDGPGTVDVNLFLKERKGKKYLFQAEVKDSGIGISQADIKRLFTSFTQVDTSSTKSYVGTGLGLVISKELCKLMHGDIGVYSTLGLGSTFWFTFEVEEANEKAVKEMARQEAQYISGAYFTDSKPYILLVDDNHINRQVAGEILRKSGCKVDLASSGHAAIEFVLSNRYDLIFMDIQMPVMDGVETTRKLRALDIEKLPPIVAMTAYAMKEDRDKFLKAGMDDYLSKPIQAQVLINKVAEKVGYQLNEQKEEEAQETVLKNEEEEQKSTVEVEYKVVNRETLSQLEKYGGKELVMQTLEEFEAEAEDLIDGCFLALKNQDYKDILSKLHTLKGNAGTLGVDQVAELTRSLEADMKAKKSVDLADRLETLKGAFLVFKNRYPELLNQNS